MLNSITHEIVAEEILKEKHLRLQYGKAKSLPKIPNKSKDKRVTDRVILNETKGKDVFGNDKISDSSIYFSCPNCSRNIAGSRFANHINRCLGGRNTKKDST